MPFGPSVLFTKSPTAMAPTNAARRAFSPFSSVVPSSKICVGLKDAYGARSGLVGAQNMALLGLERKRIENRPLSPLYQAIRVTEIRQAP